MKRLFLFMAVLLLSAGMRAQVSPHVTASTKVYELSRLPDMSWQMGRFSEGLALVMDAQTDLCAIVSDKGDAVVPFSIPLVVKMRGLPRFSDGVIPAMLNQNNQTFYLILNGKAEVVAQLPSLSALGLNFVDGAVPAFKRVKTKSGWRVLLRYYNTQGKEIYPALWQDVTGTYGTLQEMRPFCDGLSCFYDYKTRKYGYFNREGKIVIPARFAKAHDFSEGKAVVSMDGSKWFYIDTAGQQCFGLTFSAREPQDFHEGMAIVYKNSDGAGQNACYMNDKGEILTNPLYAVNRFLGGYAFVTVLDNGTHDYVVDRDFKIVREQPKLGPHNEGNTLYDEATRTIQFGENIFTADGRLVFTDGDASVGLFHDGLAAFMLDKSCGYVNKEGEIVLLFRLSEF